MFGQLGDMYKLQKEAKKIKAELSKTHIFSEYNGVKVTVNGEQQVVSIEFLDEASLDNKDRLAKDLLEAINKAMKKAQTIAAEKMKSVMGGFPGLGGQ
ncbi:YbaB/EbfC family nucleoid-associated protein [Candidatus Gracilibacteria bacterium]|nr:YbaB/EbfC family nucleoid-associated protein [Candidatus Gracilibacteria bacterium]MCF7819483.1 YbaB/EbfC family nucleoid-associated protein [Candidatus Gracilibacteria bacterium]